MTIQLIPKTQQNSLGVLLPANCQAANAKVTDLTLSHYFSLSKEMAEVQFIYNVFFISLIAQISQILFPCASPLLMVFYWVVVSLISVSLNTLQKAAVPGRKKLSCAKSQ